MGASECDGMCVCVRVFTCVCSCVVVWFCVSGCACGWCVSLSVGLWVRNSECVCKRVREIVLVSACGYVSVCHCVRVHNWIGGCIFLSISVYMFVELCE